MEFIIYTWYFKNLGKELHQAGGAQKHDVLFHR